MPANLAPSLESTAPEVGAVVDVQCLRQPGDRPRFGDLALPQPSRFVEDGVQQAQTRRQPGGRVHRQVKTRHHTAADIHRQRQPRPADRLPGFLVNDEDIRLRMVDLNDLQRPGGGKHPSNRLCLLDDLVFAAPFGALLQVDLFESSTDRSAMRRLEPGRDAVRLHIPDQLRNGRTISRQVVSADRRTDDLFPLVIQYPVALWSTALALHQ